MPESIHDIILQSINRDRLAFRKLVESHQSYAFKLAFRLLCHEEDARDVVQESFIRVWKHLPTFNPQNKFTTWLYGIATNLGLRGSVDGPLRIDDRSVVAEASE